MDIDHSGPSTNGPSATATDDAVVDGVLTELNDVLAQLEQKPTNIPLLRSQIRLLQQLGMAQEALDVILQLASLCALNEDLWLSYLDALSQLAPRPLNLDSFVEILERFHQAEKDYLSLPILLKHVDFIIQCSRSAPTASSSGDAVKTDNNIGEDVAEYLSTENTRNLLRGVVQQGSGLLSESHLLWQPWIEWEMALLSGVSGDARDAQLDHIHLMFTERMAIPHTQSDATSSTYSSFCSEFCPTEYEQRMVAMTEASLAAKTKLSGEKRYGKTRQDYEMELSYASNTTSQGAIYTAYIQWETDSRAKNPKHPTKSPAFEPHLIRAVFERALTTYTRGASTGQAAVDVAQVAIIAAKEQELKKKKKGKGKQRAPEPDAEGVSPEDLEAQRKAASDIVYACKVAEAAIWDQYASWLAESGTPEDAETILLRAARACPQVGSTWCRLMLQLETNDRHADDLNDTFDRAISLGLLTEPNSATSNLVDLFLQKAGYENRTLPPLDIDGKVHPVLLSISTAFDLIASVDRAGDSSLRLEKFLLDWAEVKAPEGLDEAIQLVSKPNKVRSSSYQMVLLRTGVECRRKNIDGARDIYINAIGRSDLDWPETVYEAFFRFESIYGTLQTMDDAKKRIMKEQEKLTRRREKATQAQMEQYQLYTSAADPAVISNAGTAIDTPTVPVSTLLPAEAPAAQHTADANEQMSRRDREHCTILVAGLPESVDKSRIESQFAECGAIREIIMIAQEADQTALVEFKFADAVPAALAKNGRRVEGQPISVAMLWRATLFVTNFPREMDDPAIRQLFSQHGHVLQTRWPSRKYSDARRFCYLTMDSPASAQHALDLDGKQMPNGFKLSVKISDPAAKTKRTDATDSKLFVGGLDFRTTEAELQELFEPYGTIVDLKLPRDPTKKTVKGFAFIEFSIKEEAEAALALSGFKFKSRVLQVAISDPNFANKKAPTTSQTKGGPDKQNRSVRLQNLPENVQEGLLQQALEKIVPVVRLEVFGKQHEALVLLEKAEDAGKLLLRAEPFEFEGAIVTFTDSTRRPPPPRADTQTTDARPRQEAAPTFAPASVRKAKALGKGRAPPAVDRSLPPAFVAATGASSTTITQDSLRDFVTAKNSQRKDRLVEAQQNGHDETSGESHGGKRKIGEVTDGEESKRARTEA